MAQKETFPVKIIALTLSILSVGSLMMTMAAGLKTAHGETLITSHLNWGFISLGLVLLTLAFFLMFIFKMHGIIHQLMDDLEKK